MLAHRAQFTSREWTNATLVINCNAWLFFGLKGTSMISKVDYTHAGTDIFMPGPRTSPLYNQPVEPTYRQTVSSIKHHRPRPHAPPSSGPPLLLLHSPTSCLLCTLHTLPIRLRISLPHSHQATLCLPRPLQISHRRLPKQIDLDQVALESALERDDALDE